MFTSSPMYLRYIRLTKCNLRTVKRILFKSPTKLGRKALLNFRKFTSDRRNLFPSSIAHESKFEHTVAGNRKKFEIAGNGMSHFKDDRLARIGNYKSNYNRGNKTLLTLKPNSMS